MNVAVMGYGVVGSGVVEILEKNNESLRKKMGVDSLNVKYILDKVPFPKSDFPERFVSDVTIIQNDPEVAIVVEAMGGLHPAFEFVMGALNAGKSVVTSNKELVAEKGLELHAAARENNVNFLFEASVGGGIPIIRPITQCLAANEIDEIAGILNGTTNFILSKMIDDGMTFEAALQLAMDNGYAEADPTADVEGLDACRKIAILAALCFGRHVYPDNVYTEGITKITLEDVEYAASWGGVIKLLGIAQRVDDKAAIMVRPCFVKNGSQFASVSDVFNAILVRGDSLGDVVFYGRGAGKLPTASAVVADVIDCARNPHNRPIFGWEDSQPDYIVDIETLPIQAYVRLHTQQGTPMHKLLKENFKHVHVLSRKDQPEEEETAAVVDAESEQQLRKTLAEFESQGVAVLSIMKVTDY